MLFQFAEQQRSKVRTTYLLSGWTKVGDGDGGGAARRKVCCVAAFTAVRGCSVPSFFHATPWCLQEEPASHVHRLVDATRLQGAQAHGSTPPVRAIPGTPMLHHAMLLVNACMHACMLAPYHAHAAGSVLVYNKSHARPSLMISFLIPRWLLRSQSPGSS